mmetsp:Transcript_3943/g.11149  ORF Transcript_3943/g.11149 Transcript_3943/m.11149 type:complete len:1211 (+) Transcript_3943:1-3633(+)
MENALKAQADLGVNDAEDAGAGKRSKGRKADNKASASSSRRGTATAGPTAASGTPSPVTAPVSSDSDSSGAASDDEDGALMGAFAARAQQRQGSARVFAAVSDGSDRMGAPPKSQASKPAPKPAAKGADGRTQVEDKRGGSGGRSTSRSAPGNARDLAAGDRQSQGRGTASETQTAARRPTGGAAVEKAPPGGRSRREREEEELQEALKMSLAETDGQRNDQDASGATFTCPICSQAFDSERAVDVHIESAHVGDGTTAEDQVADGQPGGSAPGVLHAAATERSPNSTQTSSGAGPQSTTRPADEQARMPATRRGAAPGGASCSGGPVQAAGQADTDQLKRRPRGGVAEREKRNRQTQLQQRARGSALALQEQAPVHDEAAWPSLGGGTSSASQVPPPALAHAPTHPHLALAPPPQLPQVPTSAQAASAAYHSSVDGRPASYLSAHQPVSADPMGASPHSFGSSAAQAPGVPLSGSGLQMATPQQPGHSPASLDGAAPPSIQEPQASQLPFFPEPAVRPLDSSDPHHRIAVWVAEPYKIRLLKSEAKLLKELRIKARAEITNVPDPKNSRAPPPPGQKNNHTRPLPHGAGKSMITHHKLLILHPNARGNDLYTKSLPSIALQPSHFVMAKKEIESVLTHIYKEQMAALAKSVNMPVYDFMVLNKRRTGVAQPVAQPVARGAAWTKPETPQPTQHVHAHAQPFPDAPPGVPPQMPNPMETTATAGESPGSPATVIHVPPLAFGAFGQMQPAFQPGVPPAGSQAPLAQAESLAPQPENAHEWPAVGVATPAPWTAPDAEAAARAAEDRAILEAIAASEREQFHVLPDVEPPPPPQESPPGAPIDGDILPPPPPPLDAFQDGLNDAVPPPPPISDLDLDESLPFVTEVGSLLNRAGANTCFVNVIIQMLWGIDSFREAFFEERVGHQCQAGPENCVFCAMAQVFESLNAQVQGHRSTPASAEILQQAVSVLNGRLEFGKKQDATEVHEVILNGLDQTLRDSSLSPGTESTFVRRVFNNAIQEHAHCETCGHTEKPHVYETWAEYVWARDLMSAVDEDGVLRTPFVQILRRTVGELPGICQNDSCAKELIKQKLHVSRPDVYSLVIVHESESVSQADIKRTLDAVESTMDVAAIYSDDPAHPVEPKPAVLRHVNAFAFAHYVAFTWNEVANAWLLRDDSVCKVVGPSFEDVKAKCIANRYQPGLLLYEIVTRGQ